MRARARKVCYHQSTPTIPLIALGLDWTKNNLTSKFGAILGKLNKKEQKFKLRGR